MSEVLIRWQRRTPGVAVGRGVRFVGRPVISVRPSSSLFIGDGVRLISASRLAALGVNHAVVIRTLAEGARIRIGDDVGVTGGSVTAAVLVDIGAGSMLGANAVITDTDFHPLHNVARRYLPIPEGKPDDAVTLGTNVFIGAGAMVLKGVTVGDNSVIGAGSIVSTNIPPNCVAAGVPARVLYEFSPSDWRPA